MDLQKKMLNGGGLRLLRLLQKQTRNSCGVNATRAIKLSLPWQRETYQLGRCICRLDGYEDPSNILLYDVLTTRSTQNAAVKCLKDAGVSRVGVLP